MISIIQYVTQIEFRKVALFTRQFVKEVFYSQKPTLRSIQEIEHF